MKCYNTKIIDFGNGNKQVITYSHPIVINNDDDNDDDNNDYNNNRIRSDKKKSNENLSEIDIEKKAFHSFTTSSNRSKAELYKIARSNEWEWFITFTFDEKKVIDRTDYDFLLKKVGKYFNNWKNRKCPNLKYLFVPEMHKKLEKNGLRAWHFHGLVAGANGLTFIKLTDEEKLYYDIDTEDDVYKIKEYKLGFCTATKIVDSARASNYISKYMTKQLCYTLKNKSRYIASRNCNKPSEYTYMCMQHNDSMYDYLVDHVYLSDLIDITKVKYHSKKSVLTDDFENEYNYYEIVGDYSPIIRPKNIITKKEKK